MKRLRKLFVTGLFVLLPVVATIYILLFLFNIFDGLFRGVLQTVFGRSLPGVDVVFTLLLVLLTGFLATNIIGKKIIVSLEKMIGKVPVMNSVYSALKQVVDAFSPDQTNAFQRVAMVEYPRKGTWSIGFVTGISSGEVQRKTEHEVLNIFIPTTPNPTSGFLIFVPKQDVIFLEMSVEDGLKLIISGGVITPKEQAEEKNDTSHI